MSVTLQDNLNRQDFDHIRRLYISAFPPEERPPFFLVKHLLRRESAALLMAQDEGTFVGFAYLVSEGDMVYLYYLAIDDALRGKGYGTTVLEALRARYRNKTLFLAREPLDEGADNAAERLRRWQFYRHNGFQDFPLRIREGSVTYDVMGAGAPPRPEDYNGMMLRWRGKLLRRALPMEMEHTERSAE